MNVTYLDSRCSKILKKIINSYIKTAMPVSSNIISKSPGVRLSSASVRNVMSELENLGFITHIHTSSGRVPTDLGYRYFIDYLMEPETIDKIYEEDFKELYIFNESQIDYIIERAAKILSHVTGQAGFVLYPKITRSKLKHWKLIRVGKRHMLMVLVKSFHNNIL